MVEGVRPILGGVTQEIAEECEPQTDPTLLLLREILEELRALRVHAERAAGFLDNPVRRYRESMRRNRASSGDQAGQ